LKTTSAELFEKKQLVRSQAVESAKAALDSLSQ